MDLEMENIQDKHRFSQQHDGKSGHYDGHDVSVTVRANDEEKSAKYDGNMKDSTIVETEEPTVQNGFVKLVVKSRSGIHAFCSRRGKFILRCIMFCLILLYSAYLGYAIFLNIDNFDRVLAILVITALVLIFNVYGVLRDTIGDAVVDCCIKPVSDWWSKKWTYIKWVVYASIVLAVILFLVFDTGRNPGNFRSAGGLVIFLAGLFLTSTHPGKVRWRPVLWGLMLQFLLGLLILRWSVGYNVFKFLGAEFQRFVDYTDEGSKVMFGEQGLVLHPVVFKILPVIIYLGAIVNVLYYWGVLQWLIIKMAWVMEVTMTTTAIESLHAAASIFIGQIETAVMFRPYFSKLTASEWCAVMTAGFGTISGTVLAAYIEFGAPAEHLLSASIMSAPAALAIAKLGCPETSASHTKTQEDVTLQKSDEQNVVEAACNGAVSAVKLIGVIVANFIAFLGIMAFLNATLSYLGGLVGYSNLSFQLITQYVFAPLALVIGVDVQDATKVGGLIGTKIFFNELIAFSELGPLVKSNQITYRSRVISTYALSGFGSVPSVGIYMGALMACVQEPVQRSRIVSTALRAVIYGNVACMMTASIAGLLYQDSDDTSSMIKMTLYNATINATSSGHIDVNSSTQV